MWGCGGGIIYDKWREHDDEEEEDDDEEEEEDNVADDGVS